MASVKERDRFAIPRRIEIVRQIVESVLEKPFISPLGPVRLSTDPRRSEATRTNCYLRCCDFSEALRDRLNDIGFPTTLSSSADKPPIAMFTDHAYLVVNPPNSRRPQDDILIDPTITQFYPERSEIFVGTRGDLKRSVRDRPQREVFNQVWGRRSVPFDPTAEPSLPFRGMKNILHRLIP